MPRTGRHNSGLTLVELLMALAITGLIGAALAAMLFAVAQGTSSRNDLRVMVVKEKVIEARLDAAVRASKKILAAGSNYVVLWMADGNNDSQVNVTELRRIEWNATAGTLSSYKSNLTPGAPSDTGYVLSSDFNSVTTTLKGTASFPSETWATQITAWTFTLSNNSNPQQATLVSYRGTLQAQTLTTSLIGAVALRNP